MKSKSSSSHSLKAGLDRREFEEVAKEFCQLSKNSSQKWMEKYVNLVGNRSDLYLTWNQVLEEGFQVWHVVYSTVYQVPVLYFNRYNSSGELIPWQDMVGVVSQGEHPLLGIPFYFIHPCNTQNVMKEMDGNLNYIVSWLSLMGNKVGLTLPLEFTIQSPIQ